MPNKTFRAAFPNYNDLFDNIQYNVWRECPALRCVATVELIRAYSYSSRLLYETTWFSSTDAGICINVLSTISVSACVLPHGGRSIDFCTDACKKNLRKKTKRKTISSVQIFSIKYTKQHFIKIICKPISYGSIFSAVPLSNNIVNIH